MTTTKLINHFTFYLTFFIILKPLPKHNENVLEYL